MTGPGHTTEFAVRYEVPRLNFSTVVGFRDSESLQLAESFLLGRVSGSRLPPTRHHRTTGPTDPALWIDIEEVADGRGLVAFRGLIDSPRYEVLLDGFHWDFSKVINTLVMESAVGDALLPVHAAVIGTPSGVVLLPGASGAGKSSISYAALSQAAPVHASELAFVRDGEHLSGNSALTIDRAAIDLFELPPPSVASRSDGTRLAFDLPDTGAATVSRLVFPQVHPGKLQVREITDRRARMLLFENVMTQLPLMQLLSQETWPIWRPPTRAVVERVMGEVTKLSALGPVVATGHPAAIAAAVVAGNL